MGVADATTGTEALVQARRRVRVLAWSAHAGGAFVVFVAIGFLLPLLVDPSEMVRLALVNAPVALAYVALSGWLVERRFGREVRTALRWVAEHRGPTEDEHRRTLGLAVFDLRLNAVAWIVAGVVFSVLNAAVESWPLGAVVAVTIWLGGETMCALVYLLDERALRPVTARALASRPTSAPTAPGVRRRLTWGWVLGTGLPLFGVVVVGVVGVTSSEVDTTAVSAAVVFLAVVAIASGFTTTAFAARSIAEPLLRVRRGQEAVRRGELDARVDVDDGSEVGLLQAGFNEMVGGLRERERLRDLFGRQVGADVARAALRDGVRFAGEEREVGVLFVDVVGSTTLAASAPARDVVALLNRFFAIVVDVVEDEHGLVNKFQGDAALCVFGAPVAHADPAGDALRAARALAWRLSRDLPEIDFGIGVSAGPAVAGNVGAERRFEYTVIGDPVNEAARLCELAKQRPERVLSSATALGRAADEAEVRAWRTSDDVVLRGRLTETRLVHPQAPPAGPATEPGAPSGVGLEP